MAATLATYGPSPQMCSTTLWPLSIRSWASAWVMGRWPDIERRLVFMCRIVRGAARGG